MKKIIIILASIVVLSVLIVMLSGDPVVEEVKKPVVISNSKEATYIIEGVPVTLRGGISKVEIAPGSATQVVTRYFGNEARDDFDGDGREDVAFLLTQERGGSGTFYYVVAALNTPTGFVGSKGLFLGDRIAPQSTSVSQNPKHKHVIVVNYAVRNPEEGFDVKPSLGKSLFIALNLETMEFVEAVEESEVEIDPRSMSLGMRKWEWTKTLYTTGYETVPELAGSFVLTFLPGGQFSATTDCNIIEGSYVVTQKTILFEKIVSTELVCEGSLEFEFKQLLANTVGYYFTTKGELIFELASDKGSVIFR